MYYRVNPDTKTYQEFENFYKKVEEYNKIAIDFRNSLGFTKHLIPRDNVGGGILAVYSPTQPEGYKKFVSRTLTSGWWQPKANNKEMLEKFNSLPTVTRDELNEIIGFKKQFLSFVFVYGYAVTKSEIEDCYIIGINEKADFSPSKDLVEILASEYKRLSVLQGKPVEEETATN